VSAMIERKESDDLGQQNRRTATILLGWIVVLALASILVIVIKH